MSRSAPSALSPFPYTTLFRSLRVAVHHRGGEVGHRFAGPRIDGLADLLAVDRMGDRLAAQCTGLTGAVRVLQDRKSTRLNSSHVATSYAVSCLQNQNTSKE